MRTPTDWTSLAACGCCEGGDDRPAGASQGVTLVRCDRCGTLRFSAVVAPETVYRNGYHFGDGEFGCDYESQAERGYEEAMADDRLRWIERYLRPGRLVDVGGGLGFMVSAAAKRGWGAELLEPVGGACEFARERLGVTVIQGGAEHLAERAGVYDLVSFTHCIEHIPAARETLRSAGRALRDGGLLFVEVPNHGSMARRLQGERWLGWQAGEHVYVFTRRTLLGLVEAAGFDVVAARSYVPGWEGLDPHGYAHMLGLEPLLSGTVRLRRTLSSRGAGGAMNGSEEALPPIHDERGLKRRVFTDGFRVVARAEELFGVGTNLQVLARRRP